MNFGECDELRSSFSPVLRSNKEETEGTVVPEEKS